MKKGIAIAVSLMLVLAFAAVSFARTKTHSITGIVTAVDTEAKTVSLKTRKGEVVLSFTEKTSVKEGKEKKSLADVKTGDKVTARYTEADGKKTAQSIAIKTAAMKHEMKKMEKQAAPAPAAPEKKEPAAAGY
jgi:Cu/Ag efflux protein CusF